MSKKQGAERIIKKYPNRRLYDTQTSSYITLADVKQQVISGAPFRVLDAKTDEDLTRSILLQIILEEEAGGQPYFTEAMLSQFIRFYGHAMQGVMGKVLEKNMQAFADMQQQFKEQAEKMMGSASPSNFANLGAEAWQKMMSQNPMMNNVMQSYGEQGKDMIAKMQQQFTDQAEKMMGVFGKR